MRGGDRPQAGIRLPVGRRQRGQGGLDLVWLYPGERLDALQ